MGLFSGLKKNKGDAQPYTSSVAARATTVSFTCSVKACADTQFVLQWAAASA
jgi:hypothetical protein